MTTRVGGAAFEDPPGRQPGARSWLRRHLGEAEHDDLHHVLISADRVARGALVASVTDPHDFATARSALRESLRVVRQAASGRTGARTEAVACADDLDDLVRRLADTADRVHTAEVRYRDAAVRAARDALETLQDVTSVAALVTAGAEAVCRLGFDRALVSRLEESVWVTEAMHVDGDSGWAAEILAAGQRMPQQITHGLPEQDLVRRRRPILVTGVQQLKHIHRSVAEASQTRSYVAASIVPRDRVVGFLHADRFFHAGDVSQFDRDLLGLFAQGYSFALERAMALEDLARLRADVHQLAAGLHRVADGASGLAVAQRLPDAVGAGTTGTVLSEPPGGAHASGLTRREQEVLRLMASGDTNQRIGRKLVISEGTVKSHVKHILRKLGAANRAEAVALWHSTGGASRG